MIDYSLFIKHPSPDIELERAAGKAEPGETFNATIAVRELQALDQIGFTVDGVPLMPAYVVDLLKNAIEAGHYRVELLIGSTEYKLYRKLRQ
jgi:hypothetical protein